MDRGVVGDLAGCQSPRRIRGRGDDEDGTDRKISLSAGCCWFQQHLYGEQ